MNQLIALGYAMRGSEKTLADLMKDGQTVLADIRDNPICTWSERWNQPALREAYPGRYWPLRELGNANHADPAAGIRLNDPERGIALLVKALKRRRVVILCACANFETCHRRTVVELADQAGVKDIWLAEKNHLKRWLI